MLVLGFLHALYNGADVAATIFTLAEPEFNHVPGTFRVKS